MPLYLDSGALLKLYLVERGSEKVAALATDADSLMLGSLQVLEAKTALRAAAGRGQLAPDLAEKIDKLIEQDMRKGVYSRIHPDWESLFVTAQVLSNKYTEDLLCRSLDILHVAIAVHEGASLFVTGDKRQAALSRAACLQTKFIFS